MKDLLLISKQYFKNFFKINNLVYILPSFLILIFSSLTRIKAALLILLLIIITYAILRSFKNKLIAQIKEELTSIKWILIPLFFYSLFFNPKLLGLLFIPHFFSDRVARVARITFKPSYLTYFPKSINGSIAFIIANYLLSLLFFYFCHISITKVYLIILLINSIVFALLENLKIENFKDNLNITIFGSIFLYLSFLINLHVQINGMNIIFGSIVCLFFLLIFIAFDLVNLKTALIFFLYFLLLYTGFGYFLFIFNIIILLIIGFLQKSHFLKKKDIENSFINISTIQYYFLISVIITLIYFIIPHRTIIKSGLVIGLITGILHYYYNHNPLIINKNNIILNLVSSFILLIVAYFLGLINIFNMLLGFIIINGMILGFLYYHKKITLSSDLIKLFMVYIPFQILILLNLL